MGLLGKSFRDFVGNQVRKRQEVLGEYSSRFAQGDKTKAFMTNTPWIRLASAVDLETDKGESSVYDQMDKKGLFDGILNQLTGDNLAKNFVLFGGVNNNVGGIDNAYSGLNSPNSSKIFGGAYGFGAWNQLFDSDGEGFKPMPGITNVDFSYRNDGALSQASVTVKAFNRTQFQIIDVLFQRPGYTVLLEFGHSVFVDNDGVIQYAGDGEYSYATAPFKTLFNTENNSTSEVSHYTLAKDISSEKGKWDGNYEGAFMKITKYKWKYNTDGSYDITVNLVGMGDIISSLKTNMVPVESITEESGNDENNTTGRDVENLKDLRDSGNFLIGNALSSTLNLELYKIYRDNDLDKGVIRQFFTSENIKSSDGTIKDFPIPEYDEEGLITSFELKELKISNGVFIIEDYDNESDVEKYNNLCYITFGYLTSLITKYINLRDGKTPYLFFDLNYEDGELKNDENFLATYQGNLSSDPLSVLIPFKSLSKDILDRTDEDIKNDYKKLINKNSEIRKGLVEINESFFVEGDHTKGRLERVYLDINYIARTINENTTDGECKLIDFLDQILNDINNNLGGINNFRIIFNQDKQLASFISEVPANTEEEENLTTINTVGITPGQGSFLKDLDLNAELSDDFATIVSIGAQANGNNLQGNAGSFSLYNKGLIDRIIPIKDDTQDPPEGKDAAGNEVKDPIKNIISEDFIDALEEIYDDFNFFPDYINIISSYNSSITPLITGELMKEKKYPAPFFLPFNLGLTLHGLGGVRIYDGFRVDGKVLPPSYNPESVSLIIKSLSHSVSLDGWTTKIETLAKPIFGEIKQLDNSPSGESTTQQIISNNRASQPTSEQDAPIPLSPESIDRFNAMKNSFNNVFSQQGEKSGMCSRWTYNLALNYCRSLKNNPGIPGVQIAAGGNANQNNQYYKNLVKLGYTQTKVGTNISKQKCISLVNNTVWGYGDVIVYYANDGEGTHRTYGHTQIYVGGLVSSKWATSKKNNYGAGFVYGGRKSNKWDFYVFRAPENTSQVKI